MKYITLLLTIYIFFNLQVFAQSMDTSAIHHMTDRSDVIVVAKILEIKPPFPGRGGFMGPATQKVVYKVEITLKGDINDEQIMVEHYVSQDFSVNDTPCLPPKLFKKKKELILFINHTTREMDIIEQLQNHITRYCIADSTRYGVLDITDTNIETILKCMESPLPIDELPENYKNFPGVKVQK